MPTATPSSFRALTFTMGRDDVPLSLRTAPFSHRKAV